MSSQEISVQGLSQKWTLHQVVFQKQVAFKPKAPKAHKLQPEEIYMQDDSICGHSAEFTSSDDSFCLQMQIQHTQAKLKQHLILSLT